MKRADFVKSAVLVAALAVLLPVAAAHSAEWQTTVNPPVAMVVQNQSSHLLLVDIQVSVFSEAGAMLGTCAINQLLGSPYNSGIASCLIPCRQGQKITGWEWKGMVTDTRPGGTALSLSGQKRTQQEILMLYDDKGSMIAYRFERSIY